jgi:hypothetical protein
VAVTNFSAVATVGPALVASSLKVVSPITVTWIELSLVTS